MLFVPQFKIEHPGTYEILGFWSTSRFCRIDRRAGIIPQHTFLYLLRKYRYKSASYEAFFSQNCYMHFVSMTSLCVDHSWPIPVMLDNGPETWFFSALHPKNLPTNTSTEDLRKVPHTRQLWLKFKKLEPYNWFPFSIM